MDMDVLALLSTTWWRVIFPRLWGMLLLVNNKVHQGGKKRNRLKTVGRADYFKSISLEWEGAISQRPLRLLYFNSLIKLAHFQRLSIWRGVGAKTSILTVTTASMLEGEVASHKNDGREIFTMVKRKESSSSGDISINITKIKNNNAVETSQEEKRKGVSQLVWSYSVVQIIALFWALLHCLKKKYCRFQPMLKLNPVVLRDRPGSYNIKDDIYVKFVSMAVAVPGVLVHKPTIERREVFVWWIQMWCY